MLHNIILLVMIYYNTSISNMNIDYATASHAVCCMLAVVCCDTWSYYIMLMYIHIMYKYIYIYIERERERHLYIYIYIMYIEIERERERERETFTHYELL